jgi:hypothetical protein
MLTPEQAENFANAFNEIQLSRAAIKYDKLLRQGLDEDMAVIAAV